VSNADTADVLVVGASLGGLAVAENLRWAGYAGSITLVGDEPDLPYDRPPLSKEALGSDDFEQDAVVFHPQEWYEEQLIAL
jgi:3-phenylpropionate/trans-cinnamate dioxygenase ferredoxin reductase subunit